MQITRATKSARAFRSSLRMGVSRGIFIVFALVLLGGFVSCVHIGAAPSAFNEGLHPVQFRPRAPIEWSMPNGMKVLYLEDSDLPLVRGTLYVPRGTLWDPDFNGVMTAAMAPLMRTGGAGAYSADELDRELKLLSASIGSTVLPEFATVSFSALSSDVDRVFNYFEAVVRAPRFEKSRIELIRGQLLESIRRRTDDAENIAHIALSQLLFPQSAFGRVSTSEDVKSITRDRLLAAYRQVYKPDGALLTLTGRLTRDQAEKLVSQHFGSWKGPAEKLTPPPITLEPAPAIYFVTAPFEQSAVLIGEQGVPRHTPDYYAILAFNEVFGGNGLSSRLFTDVRSEKGLAYAANGAIAPGVVKGVNLIALGTKAETTGQAIRASLDVLKGLQEKEVPARELEEKKLSIVNSFVFENETSDATLRRRALFSIYGYPSDFDDSFTKKVSKVGPDEIRAVARTRWDVSKLIVIVVGNESSYNSLVREKSSFISPISSFPIIRAQFNERLVVPSE